jgi:hypothetical protein
MNIISIIAEEIGVRNEQVEAAVRLIDEGNTIPFIARYRKEATGNLDDEKLRHLNTKLTYLRNLEARKEEVIALIDDQGKLTEELKASILSAEKLVTVEDLYRPYALGLVSSDLVSEDLKPAYSREAEMCALNQVGTPAADIRFTTLGGKRRTLYSIDSDLVLFFFSNPGCPACEDVIERLTLSQSVKSLISSGRLAVVNLYIDLEIDKWRAYASEYPKSWINGFDQDYTIRQDLTYNVRAIPSMYVLDKDKVVLIKDAPVERGLAYLENI